MCHVSSVMCHVSHVMCHVSHVMRHMSQFFLYKDDTVLAVIMMIDMFLPVTNNVLIDLTRVPEPI